MPHTEPAAAAQPAGQANIAVGLVGPRPNASPLVSQLSWVAVLTAGAVELFGAGEAVASGAGLAGAGETVGLGLGDSNAGLTTGVPGLEPDPAAPASRAAGGRTISRAR